MRKSRSRRTIRTVASAILAITLLAGVGRANAEETVFGKLLKFFDVDVEEAAPAEMVFDIADGAIAENQYTPLLKKLLGSELHFVQKVCNANDAQMKEFQTVGLKLVGQVAAQYEKMQNRNQREWPDARDTITGEFLKLAEKTFDEETANRYQEEVLARREAKKDAALDMMVTILDRKLILSEDQVNEITEKTEQNWEADWDRNMQVYMYDEYSPSPPDSVLDKALNDRQKNVRRGTRNNGRISFGWEQDLGIIPIWGDDGTVLWEVK